MKLSNGEKKSLLAKESLIDKAMGRIPYPCDLSMPSMLHARVVRSPHFHAKIKNIDKSEAEKMDGVEAVLTAEDVPGRNRKTYYLFEDEPVLATEKVRYKGEPVAVVVAQESEIAEEAVRKVKVDYEELPSVLDPHSAMSENAPLLFEEPVIEDQQGNIMLVRKLERGDAEKGFEEADIIVEGDYSTPFHDHAYLAPDSALAYMQDDGTICVDCSCQNPHNLQRDIATFLGIPTEKVRVRVPGKIGGAFGGKNDTPIQPLAALSVYHLEKPVRIKLSREEVFASTTKRNAFYMHVRTGADKKGNLVAHELKFVQDTGAYSNDGPLVMARAIVHAIGPYEIPNVSIEGKLVCTNNPPAGAMRGFGVPQVLFATEVQIQKICDELGIDPLELRRRNAFTKGSVTATGQKFEVSPGFIEVIDKIQTDWDKLKREKRGKNNRKGIGLASAWFGTGYTGAPSSSRIRIELNPSGIFKLYYGGTDLGQQSTATMAMIAVGELNQPPEMIEIEEMDTGTCEDAGTTNADRQTVCSGNATRKAVHDLVNKIKERVARDMNCSKENIQLEPGQVVANGRRIPLKNVAKGEKIVGLGEFTKPKELIVKDMERTRYLDYSFGIVMAEVEVDVETGMVDVKRVKDTFNVGKAINPIGVIGQLDGGVGFGLSQALREKYISGQTDSFTDYKILRFTETPEIDSEYIEIPQSCGPYGAVGIGEATNCAVAPAIANAIKDACGVWVQDLPITSERLRKTLKSSRASCSRRIKGGDKH